MTKSIKISRRDFMKSIGAGLVNLVGIVSLSKLSEAKQKKRIYYSGKNVMVYRYKNKRYSLIDEFGNTFLQCKPPSDKST